MGLFDFLGNALGSQNKFHVEPMSLDNTSYKDAISKANEAALGTLNLGQGTAEQQKALAEQLAMQASGQGPSLAQMQLQQAADQNTQNAAALAASQKGINPGRVGRQVALAQQAQGQNLANQSAQLRLQEQLQKQNLLAQTLGTQRGQDIGQQAGNLQAAGTFGNLQNQQNLANLQNYYNAANINAGIAAQNTASNNQLGGGILNSVAGLGGIMLSKPPAGKAHGGYIEESQKVALSPGEKVIGPEGQVSTVPGKAPFAGDDPKNDIVTADLREGSVVVPRTKANDRAKLIEFMKNIKQSSKKKSDLQELMDSHNDLKQKLEEINYKLGKWVPK